MARLHFVKKARKDNKAHGIKKGDSYYWWSLMVGSRGVKRYSKTRPRRSQLTNSEFLGAMYDAEDSITDAVNQFNQYGDFEGLASVFEEVESAVRETGESCEEKYNNMPSGLQEGDTGQLLQSRSEQCGQIADELESAASDVRGFADKDDKEEAKQNAISRAEDIGWDYE